MLRYRVIADFRAKEHAGPFSRIIPAGQQVLLMRWSGEEHDQWAIFVMLINNPQGPGMSPAQTEYEAFRQLFESSTEPIA
jgi:hypothetical protein